MKVLYQLFFKQSQKYIFYAVSSCFPLHSIIKKRVYHIIMTIIRSF